MLTSKQKIVETGMILSAYALISIILTFPLIINLNNGIMGSEGSDAPIFFWNVWELGKNISRADFSFWTDDVFYPAALSLLYHTYTPVHSIAALSLNLFINNVVLAYNITILLFTVLGAYFSYKFFLLITSDKYASFLAGALFIFQPLWSLYASFGTLNLTLLWYLPACLYYYEQFERKAGKAYALLSGLFLGLSFLNDTYSFVFCLSGLVIYSLARQAIFQVHDIWKYFRRVLIILVSALLLSGWKILAIAGHGDYIQSIALPSLKDADFYHADLVNLIRPSTLHAIWGAWGHWFTDKALFNGNSFLGFTVITIIILFVAKKSIKRSNTPNKLFYLFIPGLAVCLFLSFGPYLHFFGYNIGIPMPYYFIQKIFPGFLNLRVPARWLMLSQLFLCGIIALMLKSIFTDTKSWLKGFLFAVLMAGCVLDAAYLPRKIILIDTPENEAYQKLAGYEVKGSVLHLPLEIKSGYFFIGTSTCNSLIYQTIHGKPMVNGYLSRVPDPLKREYETDPIINYLANPSGLPQNNIYDRETIDKFFDKYKIDVVTIDKSRIDPRETHSQQLIRFIVEKLNFEIAYNDEYVTILKSPTEKTKENDIN